MQSGSRRSADGLSIIGRAAEIATIHGFLTSVPERGGILLLEGEAGIGKTTLWLEAVEEAGAAGYRVLITRPGETEPKPAYGGLIDLLGDSIDEVLPELLDPQTSALQAALLRGPGRIEQPGRVAVATLSALRVLAAHGPVVVAVDDFQWLDAPSRRVLLHVARRLDREPIAFVATERPPTGIVGLPEERQSRLWIGPLSLAGLHHLVRARMGISLERPLLVRVARASGGNPFYALEIVRALRSDASPRVGAALFIPASLGALVSRRLGRLTPSAREAVLATYSLSRPSPELVERALELAGQSPEGLSLAVEAEALEMGAENVRLSHPLLGSVLYGRLPPSGRRELHARLASLPLESEEQARHHALSAEAPNEMTAAIVEETAAAASARGAPETAAELLEFAVRLTPSSDSEARFRRIDRSAMAYFLAGDSLAAVARWQEIAGAAPPSPLRAHAMWRLAEFGSSSVPGGFESVPALLESIVAEAKADPSLRADIEASLAEFLLWSKGPVAAQPHARVAMRLAERGRDRRVAAHVLVSKALTDFFLGRGKPLSLLERAVALEAEGLDIQTEMLPSAYRACMYGWISDAPAQAAVLLDEKLDQASREHDESSMPYLLWQRCQVAVSLGEFDAAAILAARCTDAVESSGRVGRRGGALYCQALVAAYQGRTDDALALARRALELDEPRGVLYNVSSYRGLLGFVELSLGRYEQALEWLEPAHGLLLGQGYAEPSTFRFVPDQVEALVQLGNFNEAKGVLAPFERAAVRLGRRWAIAAASRCRGLLLAATGDPDDAVETLAEAVGLTASLGQPFELARTQLALGAVARRARRRTVAKESLEGALQLFEQFDAPLWAERARRELARVGVRPAAGPGLTETECRIAELVAAGHSNPEIAAKLFMSRKTVEAHLSSAYRKLGIRSRAELAARAATLDPASSAEEQT